MKAVTLKVMQFGTLPLDLTQVKGGVEAVILNLFAGFSKRTDIELLHVSYTQEADAVQEVQVYTNVRVVYLPLKYSNELLDYFFNKKEFQRIKQLFKPDIFHIQETSPQLLRFIADAKQAIVVTQHGVMKEEIKYNPGWKNQLKFRFKILIEDHVFTRFPNIVFISNYNKKYFKGSCTNAVQIYNPVNPVFFDIASSDTPTFSLLYIGVINRRKNLSLLLQALADLKRDGVNYTLHVVGGYKELAYKPTIDKIVEDNNLVADVTFHGWLPQTEIIKLYRECNVFVLPSSQETLPVSIAEAMAAGKAVVATNVGAVCEMVDEGATGFLFERYDRAALVGILKNLSGNARLINQLGEAGRDRARQLFDPEKVVHQTIDFYKHILSQQHKRND